MKGIIPWIVAIGLLSAGGFFLVNNLQGELDDAQFMEKVNAQRVKFAEQAPFTRAAPDDKVKFDRGQLINWHKSQIGAILREHPEQKRDDRYIDEIEAKAKEGKKDKAKVAKVRERYDWMKSVWDNTLSKGAYDTVLSQYKEGIRYDITNIQPFTPPEGGKPTLKMDVLLWGPVKDQITFTGIEIQFVREIVTTDKRGRETKKQALAKIEGGGPPTILHPSGPNPDPMDWILEWPPGVMVGYYVGLPLFAPDATKFSMTLSVQIRTQGGTTLPVEFTWKNVDVRPEWRAPAGAEWEADVMEASEDELRAAGIEVD